MDTRILLCETFKRNLKENYLRKLKEDEEEEKKLIYKLTPAFLYIWIFTYKINKKEMKWKGRNQIN